MPLSFVLSMTSFFLTTSQGKDYSMGVRERGAKSPRKKAGLSPFLSFLFHLLLSPGHPREGQQGTRFLTQHHFGSHRCAPPTWKRVKVNTRGSTSARASIPLLLTLTPLKEVKTGSKQPFGRKWVLVWLCLLRAAGCDPGA